MNAINRAMNSIFDVLLTPFEFLGTEVALALVSGIFGVLALIAFKKISWQKGIKGAKDKIKGNMIAIRLYQDDLVLVFKSVVKVFLRNFQYLGLNFGPMLPLFIPFGLALAQLVVRYGFDPLPVIEEEQEVAALLPGQGTLIEIEMKKGQEARVSELRVELPDGLQALTPVVRAPANGTAYVEVIARKPLKGEIELFVGDQRVGNKEIAAGEPTRRMQPERVSSLLTAWMWPAEDTFESSSPVADLTFAYPNRELRFMPDGPGGVILGFLVFSILFGALILKPLKIQI